MKTKRILDWIIIHDDMSVTIWTKHLSDFIFIRLNELHDKFESLMCELDLKENKLIEYQKLKEDTVMGSQELIINILCDVYNSWFSWKDTVDLYHYFCPIASHDLPNFIASQRLLLNTTIKLWVSPL